MARVLPRTSMLPAFGGKMPARTFSSVDLPLPLRPMMPKQVPVATSNETSCSASKRSRPTRRKPLATHSRSVSRFSCGSVKVLVTPETVIAGGDAGLVISGGGVGRQAAGRREA